MVFPNSSYKGDDICGLSVSPRDRDDIIQVNAYCGNKSRWRINRICIKMNYFISQIWNFDAKLAVNDSVLSKVDQILKKWKRYLVS